MKVKYDSPEAEAAAIRDEQAARWALNHSAEYDRMLREAFPLDLPRIPGEWARRMAVLDATCAHRDDPNEAAA